MVWWGGCAACAGEWGRVTASLSSRAQACPIALSIHIPGRPRADGGAGTAWKRAARCHAAWRPSVQSRGAAVQTSWETAVLAARGLLGLARFTHGCSSSSSANSVSGPGLSQQGVAGRTNGGGSVATNHQPRSTASGGREGGAALSRYTSPPVPCAQAHAGVGASSVSAHTSACLHKDALCQAVTGRVMGHRLGGCACAVSASYLLRVMWWRARVAH